MNQIILKPQQMTALQYLKIKTPPGGGGVGTFKKIFFQCQLRTYINGDPVFGLVAYAGFLGPKRIGPEFPLSDVPGGQDVIDDTLPLAFGNLEIIHPTGDTISKQDKKEQGYLQKKIDELIKTEKEEALDKMILTFAPKISKNPHVYYDVTIGTTTEATNPSPPAPPSDY